MLGSKLSAETAAGVAPLAGICTGESIICSTTAAVLRQRCSNAFCAQTGRNIAKARNLTSSSEWLAGGPHLRLPAW